MQKDKTPVFLRTLRVGSFLALVLAVAVPVIGKLEGETVDTLTMFAYLFAGLIGVNAYETSSRLHQRLAALERQAAEPPELLGDIQPAVVRAMRASAVRGGLGKLDVRVGEAVGGRIIRLWGQPHRSRSLEVPHGVSGRSCRLRPDGVRGGFETYVSRFQ